MTPRLPLAAITDEFSPDLAQAAPAMAAVGLRGAELRVVFGKNIMDLSEDELTRTEEILAAHNLTVVSIASPVLKCVLPGAPEVDQRFQQDVFASRHTYDDQSRLADQAFALARRFKAPLVRVFSFWRTVAPMACYDRILRALSDLADQGQRVGVMVGLENEHACHIGTAAESAVLLAAVPHANLKLVWDPANALVAGQEPFPTGYHLLPPDRIAHVHVKDCHLEGHQPLWGPVGTCGVNWKGQIEALLADGYRGALSLETHWPGPGGDKMLASTICGWNLRSLASV